MDITCISDLHGHYPKLEGGDLLIVAGDLTARDTKDELLWFHEWATKKPYKKTIIIAGNHDNSCANGYPFYNRPLAVDGVVMPYNDVEYLCDSGTEFEGLKIWGSPWTLRFEGMNPHATAFTCETEEELSEKWALIPDDVDILVTHGPPFTIRDMTTEGTQVGSSSLVTEHIRRVRPKLWVFGHIHEAYGTEEDYSWNDTIYVNASHVNECYEPVNKPIRIIL